MFGILECNVHASTTMGREAYNFSLKEYYMIHYANGDEITWHTPNHLRDTLLK